MTWAGYSVRRVEGVAGVGVWMEACGPDHEAGGGSDGGPTGGKACCVAWYGPGTDPTRGDGRGDDGGYGPVAQLQDRARAEALAELLNEVQYCPVTSVDTQRVLAAQARLHTVSEPDGVFVRRLRNREGLLGLMDGAPWRE